MSEQKVLKKRPPTTELENTALVDKAQKVSETEKITTSPKPEEQKRDGGNDESDEEEGKYKWKTLEHHGVTFCPPYVAHGVPIIHKVIQIRFIARVNLL